MISKSGYRIYTAKVVRREEGRNYRGRGMHRLYSYAGEYAAAPKCSTIYGVPQGKKYPDDIWSSRKSEIKIWKQTLLVPGLLRRHSRKKWKGNKRVHPKSTHRGWNDGSDDDKRICRPVYGWQESPGIKIQAALAAACKKLCDWQTIHASWDAASNKPF